MGIEFNEDGELHSVSLEKRPEGGYTATVGETEYEVDCLRISDTCLSLLVGGASYTIYVAKGEKGHLVAVGGERYTLAPPTSSRGPRAAGDAEAATPTGVAKIETPMPGKVIKLLVEEGDEVKKHQGLIIVEAMKMENEIKSPRPGTVSKVNASVGAMVNPGDTLLEVGD